MYERFFGLNEPAFSVTPDPRFLWLSETHEEGLSALCYGIVRRKGFILLTGEPGAGKSTLLRATLDRIAEEFLEFPETAMILNGVGLNPLDLLKLIVSEFRIRGFIHRSAAEPTTADYLIALNQFLLERLREGTNTVLVIDEAQNLSPVALEQVRMLSNLETDTQKLLQIVLAGQPELRAVLAQPELRQLHQRIAVEHHVEALGLSEIRPYLQHRITVAGGRYEEIFPDGVESAFFDFSGGCPRLLNILADRVLLAAYTKRLRPALPALIELKAKEIAATRYSASPKPSGLEEPRLHRVDR